MVRVTRGAPSYQHVAGQNDYSNNTRWNPSVKIDLDLFLGAMMEAYLKPFAERLQIRWPGALFIEHTGAGARFGMNRKPILATLDKRCHLIRGFDHSAPESMNRLAR